MIRKIGRAQIIGIAAILIAFFAVEFVMNGFDSASSQEAQVRFQRTHS